MRSYRILLVAGHSSLCQPRRRNESEGKEIAMITFAETYSFSEFHVSCLNSIE